MIDLGTENLISLAEAARSLPSSNRANGLDPATVWRWIKNGVRARDGSTVKLDAVRIGGRLVTSRQAIARFTDALNDQPTDAKKKPKTRTPTKRRAASERAAQRLERAGV
jgi:hypothetical protein